MTTVPQQEHKRNLCPYCLKKEAGWDNICTQCWLRMRKINIFDPRFQIYEDGEVTIQ